MRWRVRLVVALLLIAAALGSGWRWPELALEAEFARLRWLAGATEHRIEISGHRWVYLEAGSGPPLLLVHGFTGSKENWLPVMGALARHYRVIAPDLPGWGESERQADAQYGFAEQVEHLAAFIPEVVGPGQVRLVGHSMGGGIAALLAARHPSLIERLVLLDAAGVEFDNEFARRVLAGEHPFAVQDRASLQRWLELVFDDPPWVPWPASRALVLRRLRDDAFERAVLARLSDPVLGAMPGEEARGLKMPVLLLWCRDDRVIDIGAQAAYAERIPHAQQRLLDGCNHMPMMEQPRAMNATLLAFLAQPGA